MDFKPQDLIFLIVLALLLLKKDAKLFAYAGIISLIISMPLFAKWIFFTAQRLTWYSLAFFIIAVILNLVSFKKIRT